MAPARRPKAPAGHVVVCQPDNREIALMGERSAQTLAARGVPGCVVAYTTYGRF